MNDSVFLGEQGISSTSANYLANLAQEIIVKDKETLASTNFCNGFIDVVGTDSKPKQFLIGKTNEFVNDIPSIIERIAKMNAFCAWVREGIKAKEELLSSLKRLNVVKWAGDRYPVYPDAPSVTEDIINTLNVKERCEYLSLEAYAAAFGKFIHADGDVNKARKEAHRRMSSPISKEDTGKNIILYNFEASADLDVVDSTFEQLQNTQRQYEARLNAIKYKLKEKENEIDSRNNSEYRSKVEAVTRIIDQLNAEFKTYCLEEKQRISKLKIIIPNELRATFEYLNSVGNQGVNS